MLEPDEIQEACEKIRRFESERITALEREQKQRNIEMEILAAERPRLQAFSRGSGSSMERKSDINMTKQLQPFWVGDVIGHYFVNFDTICQKEGFRKYTSALRLLSLLPEEATAVVAPLSSKAADDYALLKSSLLKKYKLSTEQIRRRFCKPKENFNESFVEFIYGLKADLVEWLRGAKAHGNAGRLVDLICLDKSLETLLNRVRTWIQDHSRVKCIRRVAELADEYIC